MSSVSLDPPAERCETGPISESFDQYFKKLRGRVCSRLAKDNLTLSEGMDLSPLEEILHEDVGELMCELAALPPNFDEQWVMDLFRERVPGEVQRIAELSRLHSVQPLSEPPVKPFSLHLKARSKRR